MSEISTINLNFIQTFESISVFISIHGSRFFRCCTNTPIIILYEIYYW